MKVRTRFAPSPTGVPHIGNIRTALFSYFFAKANNGEFILRIEDTDQARKVEGAEEVIKESLNWMGITWDEFIIQSERLEEYKKYAAELVDKGLARQEDSAIRFVTPKTGQTSWQDGVADKTISIENSLVEDFVILKSDGFPTYHLANIVDDHLMNVTHVIRGEDWISSTPKHIMLYQAFGWEIPKFVHVPNVNGPDGKKLSKRFGAKSALDFKAEGYLPEALVNYLVLLGWSPKNDQEILTTKEIIAQFNLAGINGSPAVFDSNKLDWLNGEYIRKMSDQELVKKLEEFFPDHPGKEKFPILVPLVKERIKTLKEFDELTDFIFSKPTYNKEVFEKLKVDVVKQTLTSILEKLEGLESPWKAYSFEQTFRKLAEDLSLPVRDTFQLVRVAISGKLITPPLFETMQIIGEAESINRLKQALEFLS